MEFVDQLREMVSRADMVNYRRKPLACLESSYAYNTIRRRTLCK